MLKYCATGAVARPANAAQAAAAKPFHSALTGSREWFEGYAADGERVFTPRAMTAFQFDESTNQRWGTTAAVLSDVGAER